MLHLLELLEIRELGILKARHLQGYAEGTRSSEFPVAFGVEEE
jgi:hypothetical protein